MYCDNSVAFMTKNNKSEIQNKYINIKYLTIREHVKDKKMSFSILTQNKLKLLF